jgi:hypothetical protein
LKYLTLKLLPLPGKCRCKISLTSLPLLLTLLPLSPPPFGFLLTFFRLTSLTFPLFQKLKVLFLQPLTDARLLDSPCILLLFHHHL